MKHPRIEVDARAALRAITRSAGSMDLLIIEGDSGAVPYGRLFARAIASTVY